MNENSVLKHYFISLNWFSVSHWCPFKGNRHFNARYVENVGWVLYKSVVHFTWSFFCPLLLYAALGWAAHELVGGRKEQALESCISHANASDEGELNVGHYIQSFPVGILRGCAFAFHLCGWELYFITLTNQACLSKCAAMSHNDIAMLLGILISAAHARQ